MFNTALKCSHFKCSWNVNYRQPTRIRWKPITASRCFRVECNTSLRKLCSNLALHHANNRVKTKPQYFSIWTTISWKLKKCCILVQISRFIKLRQKYPFPCFYLLSRQTYQLDLTCCIHHSHWSKSGSNVLKLCWSYWSTLHNSFLWSQDVLNRND